MKQSDLDTFNQKKLDDAKAEWDAKSKRILDVLACATQIDSQIKSLDSQIKELQLERDSLLFWGHPIGVKSEK